jgi:protein phosphatase 1 regulatory subunit 7
MVKSPVGAPSAISLRVTGTSPDSVEYYWGSCVSDHRLDDGFPALRSLVIEDQIRLEKIRFTPSNRNLESLRIFNCKSLRGLNGLEHLGQLKSIRIGETKLRIDSILEQKLAASLELFAFYTGRLKENAAIRKKLDALGYRE